MEKTVNVAVTPQVGDTVAVVHASRISQDGYPSGKHQDANLQVDIVKQVMIDGDVKVGSGNVWSVIPAKDGKTKWMTVKNKQL